ncbi:hypothetical protein DKX38_026664 [Salix brachista]|uniref:Dienelactone hydrolase domain-containing protein n=1 Tax=Salix brachista TaxID=2182728 RepID=A0A5N5JFB1_9ROSI|nr:hypothetical protein DKX38_026651 [Salix brachista]KAB5516016.1 hypothetical protein DKX38_026664 [Salix brachista]
MVIGALKTKGMNSIGAAGFCWGVKLASSNAFLGAEIDRASPPEQLKEFRELLSAKSQAMAEEDSPASHTVEALDFMSNLISIFSSLIENIPWYQSWMDSSEDETAAKSAEEAHGDMIHWFTMFVK